MTSRTRAAALATVAALAASTAHGLASPASAEGRGPGGPAAAPTSFALIGDTPYGPEQRDAFPALVEDINADRSLRFVLHAGDVKSGSSLCSNEMYADLAALYDTFAMPFVLTPGDNEWTDCHRSPAGQYLPTERLEAVRDAFYPVPGRTTGGRTMRVTSQARVQPRHRAYVENVLFHRSRVTLGTAHIVGSQNDLEPWSQLPAGDQPQARLAEFEARRRANLAWIDRIFDEACARGDRGVVIMMQAEPVAGAAGYSAERELLLRRAAAFGGPVLLVHGDEHQYEVERGYGGVPNLTRLETFGATATEWLRVTMDPRTKDVFTWTPQTTQD